MSSKVRRAFSGVILMVFLAVLGWAASQELLILKPLQSLESPLVPQDKVQALQEPYRFVALGDWGAGTPFQRDVASQLEKTLEHTPYDAALLLGDNIYPDGNIRKFGKAYFTDMYSALIQQKVHFIVAIGNHDVVSGHQADQLAFFQMPGYYYAVKKPGLEIFVIDTNQFAKDQVQQRWLTKGLKGSQATWKIVMGHHPVYSSGEHGMNPGLLKTLQPILTSNGANLYLAGHDHGYERFRSIQGVQYIVSGGGGAYLRNFEKPLPDSLVRVKAHHFLNFELRGDQLKMEAIDKTGKVIDQAQWHKALQAPQKSSVSALGRAAS